MSRKELFALRRLDLLFDQIGIYSRAAAAAFRAAFFVAGSLLPEHAHQIGYGRQKYKKYQKFLHGNSLTLQRYEIVYC